MISIDVFPGSPPLSFWRKCSCCCPHLIAKNFGGRLGGIFAAFPAVYLAAVIGLSMDYKGSDLLLVSEQLSKGAFVGMLADICCALAASYMILRYGWKKRPGLYPLPLDHNCPDNLRHLVWVLRSKRKIGKHLELKK